MQVPKHDVTVFDETGDVDILNELSKTHLIGATNLITGYSREDDDGNELSLQAYNNTIQKEELRGAVAHLYNFRMVVRNTEGLSWEDVQDDGLPGAWELNQIKEPEDEDDEDEDEDADEAEDEDEDEGDN